MAEWYEPHKCERYSVTEKMQWALGLQYDVFMLCGHNGMYHEYCVTWERLLKVFFYDE